MTGGSSIQILWCQISRQWLDVRLDARGLLWCTIHNTRRFNIIFSPLFFFGCFELVLDASCGDVVKVCCRNIWQKSIVLCYFFFQLAKKQNKTKQNKTKQKTNNKTKQQQKKKEKRKTQNTYTPTQKMHYAWFLFFFFPALFSPLFFFGLLWASAWYLMWWP